MTSTTTNPGTSTAVPPRPAVGVVMGRFCPPHRGHRLLIETAAAGCDELYVLAIGQSADDAFIPLEIRATWLQEMFAGPRVHVIAIHTDLPASGGAPAGIRAWCDLVIETVGRPVDALFSSEAASYGDWTAAGLGARHILVDPDRTRVPISGTAIRHDPHAALDYLDPPVRAYFAARFGGQVIDDEPGAPRPGVDPAGAREADRYVEPAAIGLGHPVMPHLADRGEL